MSFKRKEQLYQVIIALAILLGIVIGMALAWFFLSPVEDTITCFHSGGAIVSQPFGPSLCVERT